METATTRTSVSSLTFASPLVILTGSMVAASFALVSVLFGYMIGGILFGVTALALSMLSLEFGLAILFLIVILFNTEEIRSISIPFFGGGLRPTDLITAVPVEICREYFGISMRESEREKFALATLTVSGHLFGSARPSGTTNGSTAPAESGPPN